MSQKDLEERNAFFALILGSSEDEAQKPWPPSKECIWFASYLENKFRNSWTSLLCPCLVGLKTTITEPDPDEIARAYKFMALTADLLRSKRQLALSQIPDAMDNPPDRMLREQDDNGQRLVPAQLAFAAVGWLCEYKSLRTTLQLS